MKIVMIGMVAVLALGGCAKDATQAKSDYQAYAEGVAKARANQPKLFEFECPPTGCNFTKFAAYQPESGNGVQIAAPAATGWEAVWDRTLTAVERLGPWGFGYGVLREAFHATQGPVNISASGAGAGAAMNGGAQGSSANLSTSNQATSNTSNTTTSTSTNTNTTNTTNSNNRSAVGGNTTTGNAGPANAN